MNRNLWLVLTTALIFGLSTGIYEFVLPLLLRAQGFSFEKVGVIFALAGLAMVLARIYMGGLADRWGRKALYGWALLVCGLASGLAAQWPALLGQVLLKMLRETAALTRETLHPIIIYEEQRASFLNYIGKFRGVEYLLQAGGTLLAGVIIRQLSTPEDGYHCALLVAGSLLTAAAIMWALRFHEEWERRPRQVIDLRTLFNFDLQPNLRLLLISGVIFTFGMQLSHSFYLPLFFHDRFGTPPWQVAIIMVAHRLTVALPLLLVGNLTLKHLRAWYVGSMIIEGLTMVGSAIIPVYSWSVGIFLLHDLIGSGIWAPIQAMLLQRYSRDATRGIEVGKVLAWSSIGSILGPIAAGVLATASPVYPFLASGIFMGLSALPLCALDTNAPAPQYADQPADAVG